MAQNKNKILITGLFLSEKNKDKIYRTAADQLAEVLTDNGFSIIKTSTKVNKIYRAVDLLTTILFKAHSYKIAIVPFYASANAYIIENWSTKLLKLLGKKVLLIVHGGGVPNKMRGNPEKYLKVLNRVDVVVTPSPYLQFELKKYDIDCIVIENVVKLSDYKYQEKEKLQPRLLWMRALQHIYNPEMAIRVLALLKKKYPNASLIMAGKDLGLLSNCKKLAQKLNIENSVTFPGYIHTSQKNDLANKTDIYICTNRVDNAPVTFVEMMTLGLPVVSVNIGGIPYMVTNRQNGLLVDLDDDDAMANCIIELIETPTLQNSIIQNGLKTSVQFGEEMVVKKWNKLFNQILEKQ